MRFQNPAEETAMPTYRIMDADGNIVDNTRDPQSASDEEIVRWYRNMLTISILDLLMFDAQRQGRTSFYMVSAGEEGIAVGSASALTPDDVIFLQYREQGVLLQRGFTLKEMMSQLFANKDDHGKGRNMPVHYGSGKLNVHTVSSPLATQIPQASGAAYALKLQRLINPNVPPRVVACYFGEGAASEGDFHAALNIAATKSCPVVFVCRNNGFAISTSSIEQYKGDGIASRGLGYGIDTIRVDGNDIFAVREVMAEARKRALEGDCRPILVEAMSYRVSHHSTSDDSFAYRAKREVEEWKRRDNPITRLRKWMEKKGIWDEDKEKEARASIRKEVLQEFSAAEKVKKPPLRAMFEDVYEEITPEAREQMQELKRLIEKYPKEYSSISQYEGGGCAPDPALGRSVDIDFSSGASSDFTPSGAVSYTSDGAAFTISQHGDAPTIQSKWYIMFGHVDYVIKASPGTGIVSAAVLQSDCLDEIDWEWLGGDDNQAQSNYFGKGQTTTGYNRGAYHGAPNNHEEFHTYSIDWTADQIVWSIDGQTVRAMSPSQAEAGQFPQTPMFVKLGTWAGGDSSNPPGTITWSGGPTDYSAGPFTMYVKSLHVTDYSSGSQYTYSGTSGTWQSITSNGGQINSQGDGVPPSSGSAPPATSSVPNSGAPLAFGNGGDSSGSATRTGWPWSGEATATIVSSLISTFPPSSQSSSAVLSQGSPSASASFEITTSYDQQGFPTVVTVNPAASATPTCFDTHGFPTACAATVVPVSNQPATTQAPGQPTVTISGTPNPGTASPAPSSVGVASGASSAPASSPAISGSTPTGVSVSTGTTGNTVPNSSVSVVPSLGGSSTGTQPVATATSGVNSPGSSTNTASAVPTSGTAPESSSATPSETVITSNGSTFTLSATPSQSLVTTNGSTFTLSVISSTTSAGSSTTASTTRHSTTLSTTSHTSGRASTTSPSSSSTASGTPPAPSNAAARSTTSKAICLIVAMCTLLLLH
ncbi:hypothetical protein H2200_002311 [Cladophialophora chaetospira]|uniref:3-methyl-2-oxobutanoate dehydrogenase (2-methylpropanoyl-transferring) n=1 Tax=Cladophialophora chaetospira TaxID=386627 RepID=A0AA38XIM9_9EURO|nr:hypothetical protein H2200_002311 [Cladophialophora chaetospira]